VTDTELMQKTGAGDMEAFGILIERHHLRVLNLAFRLTGDAELARDIAQDCFLKLHRAADRYRPSGRFIAYLGSITRNLALDAFRQQSRHRPADLNHIDYYQQSGIALTGQSPETPERLHERRQREEQLMTALAELPEDQRSAFVLSEIEGLSYSEIAVVCDCPEGTIASRKHNALRKLQKLLQSEGDCR
jgi:RNA polymerase sigma-70 factor, ECF subfamily